MTGFWTDEAVGFVAADEDEDDDSSSWEIIDPSDDDDDDEFDYCFFDEAELSLSSYPSIGCSSDNNLTDESHWSSNAYTSEEIGDKEVVFAEQHGHGDYGYEEEGLGDEGQEEDRYFDEDGDGYELDDELVPRWVSDRFEKQRMRKLGKRAYPKMSKSKKMPHYYNRPGCVYGKHGLGLKHSI